ERDGAERPSEHYVLSIVLFLILCSVFLYLHLFLLPYNPIYIEEDHLYAIQDAWRMYNGEALYRDFFEFTFPGTQVLYLGLLNLFGTRFWIINAVIFFQGLGQAGIWLVISKVLLGSRPATLLPSS